MFGMSSILCKIGWLALTYVLVIRSTRNGSPSKQKSGHCDEAPGVEEAIYRTKSQIRDLTTDQELLVHWFNMWCGYINKIFQ